MADKSPLKATYTGSDPTGLAEFTSSDTIGLTDGGTGSSTASGARTNLDVLSTAEVETTATSKAVTMAIALG